MSTTLTGPDATRPAVDFTQEIRFAVVMYGGISLAIYINGVAQELLRLVRATAPAEGGKVTYLADQELSGSERVYRRLGRMLTRTGALDKPHEALRTRFVVDIVTGSSAGGINGVYLAKALANDQDMEELKKLWVTEGDIGMLVNDDTSYGGLNFTLGEDVDEPWSLLNSRRMYLKLLEALRGMDRDRPACPPGKSPLVDDLDLYVTTTDMAGRPVQMRLADDVVSERRHRNVFHFRHRSGRSARDPGDSDFGAAYNAFLAFAARATSAHQAAFAPVSLDDITPVVAAHAPAGEEYRADSDALRTFYRDYLLKRLAETSGGAAADPREQEEELARRFRGNWFNDGGTLDNKPFSFVAQELPLRQADTHVDRKLLYVEPSPERLSWAESGGRRPQILRNAWSGLSTLPRYETIVEDLTRLQERNRLIERVHRITDDFEDDIKSSYGGRWPRPLRREQQRVRKLSDLIGEKGVGWGAYQRLRIGQVTDDLTLLVARAAGFDEESEEFVAVRELVRHWRRANYDDHGKQGQKTEIEFLIDYDFQWTMRRVRFVLRKIDELALLDRRARKLAKLTRQHTLGITTTWPRGAAQKEEFQRALRAMREELNKVLSGLRVARRSYWAYRTDLLPAGNGGPAAAAAARNPFCAEVGALGVSGAMLQEFIKLPTQEEREKKLKAHLADPAHRAAFDRLVGSVKANFNREIEVSRKACRALLCADKFEEMNEEACARFEAGAPKEKKRLDLAESLSYVLLYYYNYFQDFDQVSYPAFYSTDVGEEADPIDVFRVSPWDARALVNEREETVLVGGEVKDVQKLAGTTFANFGAFFERKFRVNDITWGRLDGAERIIAALLPADKDLRRKMTQRAHRAIIGEEVINKIELSLSRAAEVSEGLETSGRRKPADSDLYERVRASLRLMRETIEEIEAGGEGRDRLAEIEGHLAALEGGLAGATDDSAWRSYLKGFAPEFRPFVREYVAPLTEGADRLDAFRNWFRAQYEEGRRFMPEATLETGVRASRVLGRMGLGYFAEGPLSRKRAAAIWVARRLQTFAESALQPGGETFLALRQKMTASYVLSLLPPALLVGVPLLLLLHLFREAKLPTPSAVFVIFVNVLQLALPGMGVFAPSDLIVAFATAFFTFTVVVTLLVTCIPLLLTLVYGYAWLKFKGALSRRLASLLSP